VVDGPEMKRSFLTTTKKLKNSFLKMKVEDKKGKKYVSSLLYIKAQKSKGQLS
jgi:hypothetical protein